MADVLSEGFNLQPPLKRSKAEPNEQLDQLASIIASVQRDGKWAWVRQYWQERMEYYEKRYAVEVAKDTVDYEALGKAYALAHLVSAEAQAFINQVEVTADDLRQRRAKRR